MRWDVRVLPDAKADIERAVLWYLGEAPDQVGRFLDEVDAAASRLR